MKNNKPHWIIEATKRLQELYDNITPEEKQRKEKLSKKLAEEYDPYWEVIVNKK